MSVAREDWDQWVANPVTKAYVEYLKDAVDSTIHKMLNQDPGSSKDSLEDYAIKSITLRAFIDGLGQATDLETIAEDLVEDTKEIVKNGY
jgi:23S rRNA maturation mini-RNase III